MGDFWPILAKKRRILTVEEKNLATKEAIFGQISAIFSNESLATLSDPETLKQQQACFLAPS